MPVDAIDKALNFEYCGDIQASFDQKMAGLELQIDALYELMPFGAYSMAADGTCVSINNQALLWVGCSRESILGKKLPSEKIAAANWRKLQHHADRLRLDGLDEIELDLIDAKCRIRPIGLHAKHLEVPGKSSEINHISRFVFFDLTEAKRARELQRIAAMAFESQMGICIADSSGFVLETNKAFGRITGYSSEELRGKSAAPMLSLEENGQLENIIRNALTSKGLWEGEIRERRKNGQVFTAWLSISSIAHDDATAAYFCICLYDITANKATQDEISQLAYFDSLTQLPNRRKLNRRLSEILSDSPSDHLHGALLFIDLDNFKSINDTRGHAAGDLLLIEVGHRLRHAVRGSDIVARVGGDEFVVLLSALVADPVEATHQATLVGKEILARLAKPYKLDGFIFNCSASIGISLFSHADLEADVLQQADMAMYQAKRTGRNSLCIFDPAMKDAVSAYSNLEQELGQATRRNELELFFQPQFDFDGRIISAEALLRWRHPTRGLIGPKDFICIAEESGLILPIGLWVLGEACKQISVWDSDDLMKNIPIAINVSAAQFKQPSFVEEVIQVIVDSGINPARIKFELTESMMHSIDETRIKMEKIRDFGVRFSLDDFGTGYSSLSSLIQLPLEQLKIDQSFVSNMLSRPGDQIVVKTIIGMAHSLGLEVIAEGLETEPQKDFLHLNGCSLYQGFLFSPALPADEFFAFVQTRDH
jgi:diguanylate cyclase (GGDEF)-like protein/PAS domain S-box-containing protein